LSESRSNATIYKAKNEDLTFKAKDLTFKAKAKDLSFKANALKIVLNDSLRPRPRTPITDNNNNLQQSEIVPSVFPHTRLFYCQEVQVFVDER